MNEKTRENIPIIILLIVMAIFFMTFLVSETTLFEEDEHIHTFEEAVERQLNNDTVDLKLENGSMRPAEDGEIEAAMDVTESRTEFQFLDLTEPADVSADTLDALLEDKGVLAGHGEVFLRAQSEHGINAIYLISHAQLETGNGRSELAEGIETESGTYYNFFGIGAFDHQAVEEGSSYAARAGWDSPRKAIEGGAAFIRENYMPEQNTLYAMRWNPKAPGEHLYATDIEWPVKIGRIMEGHYSELDIEAGSFEKDYYQ